MIPDQAITGITVVHNTKQLMERAYISIRKYHPDMQIIIVDGSDKANDCYKYVYSILNDKTRVFHAENNIGHGRGVQFAMQYVTTPYVLVFDSDIEMLKSPLQAMLDMFEEDTYGVGYIEKTAFDGHEYGCKPSHRGQGWMRYLHPYFCLLQLKEYKKYRPFIHHGAPAVNTCLDIHRRGLSNKVIKEFPGLGHSSGKGHVWTGQPREFIRHDPAGTRNYRRSKGQEEIEGTWEKVIDNGPGLTCITATGDRPLAFSLCQKWMERQTLTPNQWIIIDDGKTPGVNPDLPYSNYVRRTPNPKDPKHTILVNLNEAFRRVQGNKIIIIEDDEYYAPNYLEVMSEKLNKYELVGIGRSRYYFLPKLKYYVHTNMGHASLAQTGFRKSFLPTAIRHCVGDPFFDIRLWREVNGKDADHLQIHSSFKERMSNDRRGYVFDDTANPLYIGVKGMPGRLGIGSGHADNHWYINDENRSKLKEWTKNETDFNTYLNLLK